MFQDSLRALRGSGDRAGLVPLFASVHEAGRDRSHYLMAGACPRVVGHVVLLSNLCVPSDPLHGLTVMSLS
jgi:hypothetical protein